MSENLESFLKYAATIMGSALTTIGGWRLLKFVNDWRKGTTERLHESRAADLSTTELQDKLYREALSTANEAVTEALAAKRLAAALQIQLERSEQCLWDCVESFRRMGHEADADALQARVNKIHGG